MRLVEAVLVPVYNEEATVSRVLDAVRRVFSGPILVVDDGSLDGTPRVLAGRRDVRILRHPENLGYGQSLIAGFALARSLGVERLVTMDCDGQHEPKHIPEFLEALAEGGEIVSGSRYLPESPEIGHTPPQRRDVNRRICAEINRVTGWSLTDAFCGFKAYRVAALDRFSLTEPGYALPMELWAKAHCHRLGVRERPIERIYFDNDRSFGQDLDEPEKRYAYYLRVWRRALEECGIR
jgi:dolichol-phosphate mannosyltransferase